MVKNSKVDISIITVNFNSLPEIKECIRSVIEKTSSEITFEFIVVSNSIEDEIEVKSLLDLSPSIEYHQLEKNVGFAKGNNAGIKHASGEFLFFLNPDTEFLNDVLSLLLSFLKADSGFGAVGPAIFNENGEQEASVNNIPSFPSLLSQMIPFGQFLFPKNHVYGNYLVNKTSEVNVIQGSAIFIKADTMKSVGNFTDSYFMYSEETDLCFKLMKHGFKTAFLKEAELLHVGGVTTKPTFLKMEIEKHRSRKTFLKIHKPNLVLFNRISGSIAYLWRTLISAVLLNQTKVKQFGTLTLWYTIKYK